MTDARLGAAQDDDPTHCFECKAELVFDAACIGTTVGGLTRRGWLVCTGCARGWLSRRGVVHEEWKIAKGGRSVETGDGRIRVDGGDAVALCARIVQLPALEAEVAELRAKLAGEPGFIPNRVLVGGGEIELELEP